jgi:saccharopine dehydrogenase (NADP+, L-glutamate forming)
MSQTLSRVLILGSGLVSPPAIEYLSNHGLSVTVASRTVSKALKISSGLQNVQCVEYDIESQNYAELERLIKENDVVISLLPYIYHVRAAKIALKHNKVYLIFCLSL